ncbi:hypothetical protein STCU_12350 [Strigomonas culicis]|uniref:Uncharacterized protein n=1 Tax=Strigomonas culicis TaxID=28005 RepID=S9TAV8_9TRYP|nr:hypothetical protein STCU_12350 [Strigomonas culicis]|eukprot:EPY15097.1 hypothetical protein STCU_12350 [Strigomonas culicis]
MKDLEQLNHMYQYGLQDFILMFTKTLKEYQGDDSLSKKIPALIENMAKTCFHSVSVSVFKRDRLAFDLHLLQGFYAVRYPTNLWSALVGSVGTAAARTGRWISPRGRRCRRSRSSPPSRPFPRASR